MKVSLGWTKNAGLVCLWRGCWAIHLCVQRRDWSWGRSDGWWDGPLAEWGAGPLFLITYAEAP